MRKLFFSVVFGFPISFFRSGHAVCYAEVVEAWLKPERDQKDGRSSKPAQSEPEKNASREKSLRKIRKLALMTCGGHPRKTARMSTCLSGNFRGKIQVVVTCSPEQAVKVSGWFSFFCTFCTAKFSISGSYERGAKRTAKKQEVQQAEEDEECNSLFKFFKILK